MQCTVCERAVSEEDSVPFEGVHVCFTCKPGYFQRLREGVPGREKPELTFRRKLLSLYLHAIWCSAIHVTLTILLSLSFSGPAIVAVIAGILISGGFALLLHQVVRLRLKLSVGEFPGQMLLPCVLLIALLILMTGASCGVAAVAGIAMIPGVAGWIYIALSLFTIVPLELLFWFFLLMILTIFVRKLRRRADPV